MVATAATGDDVEGPGQRVAAKGSDRAADHVDPFHVVQRDEVEVNLCRVGLVHSDAVDEDAEALWQTDHRGDAEAAKREVGLRRGTQLVVGVNPRQPAQRVSDGQGAAAADLVAGSVGQEEGDTGGVDAADREAADLDDDSRQGRDRGVGGLDAGAVGRLGVSEGGGPEDQPRGGESG